MDKLKQCPANNPTNNPFTPRRNSMQPQGLLACTRLFVVGKDRVFGQQGFDDEHRARRLALQPGLFKRNQVFFRAGTLKPG